MKQRANASVSLARETVISGQLVQGGEELSKTTSANFLELHWCSLLAMCFFDFQVWKSLTFQGLPARNLGQWEDKISAEI